MSNGDLSRREFLQRTAVVGAVVGAGSLMAACGNKTAVPGVAGTVQMPALDCSDVSKLTDIEKANRTTLNYAQKSTFEGQKCANCVQFKAPTQANTCGTCKVVAGPINPEGHCLSWAPKAS